MLIVAFYIKKVYTEYARFMLLFLLGILYNKPSVCVIKLYLVKKQCYKPKKMQEEMLMKEWLINSPYSSVINIIIIVVLVVLALDLLKSIAKPILTAIVIIGVVLVVFNVIDLAMIAATGEKLLSYIWESIKSSAADAASSAISNALSGTDLPSFK